MLKNSILISYAPRPQSAARAQLSYKDVPYSVPPIPPFLSILLASSCLKLGLDSWSSKHLSGARRAGWGGAYRDASLNLYYRILPIERHPGTPPISSALYYRYTRTALVHVHSVLFATEETLAVYTDTWQDAFLPLSRHPLPFQYICRNFAAGEDYCKTHLPHQCLLLHGPETHLYQHGYYQNNDGSIHVIYRKIGKNNDSWGGGDSTEILPAGQAMLFTPIATVRWQDKKFGVLRLAEAMSLNMGLTFKDELSTILY